MSSDVLAGSVPAAFGCLFDDPAVTEVMVNGGAVWVERAGRLERSAVVLGRDAVFRLVDRLVGLGGTRVDRAAPLAELRLPDGSRANVVLPPVAPDGPCVTIRRFALVHARIADFGGHELEDLLGDAVRAGVNIVVAGATGSGKTTLLNALAAAVPHDQRIVTVEDVAELRIDHPHVVRLEARRPNADGIGEVTIRRLVVNALRMRPDRIVVGEVRGPEVLDMVQAMNTGHGGSLSTCHANSGPDALRRLEAMALLGADGWPLDFVRGQLAAAVGWLVMTARQADGARRVVSVAEVDRSAGWDRPDSLRLRYPSEAAS